ncbi:MAG: PEP-CTERM sorting domain-containing protein [Anaerolineae bacterium]|jgi:hypothetical protein
MSRHWSPRPRRWIALVAILGCLIVIFAPATQPLHAQGGIVLDGVGDDWDPAWQVQIDGLDVSLTDTGLHPHDAPTYARSGYDAIGLWAHYQASDDRWYFRIDVDGRAGDSDSQVGTEANLGVGTHGPDQGPLVVLPFVDGEGLGNSEAYKLGFQCAADAVGQTAEISNDPAILPGVLAPTTAGLDGLGVYATTVPGVVEFAFDRPTLFPIGSHCAEFWLSAQIGDNNDRVSDDQVAATLVIALDLLAQCPEAPAVAGDEATFVLDYAIPAGAQQGATDVVLTVGVPAGTQFVSASDGGTEAGGLITWALGDLPPGTAGQVTFTVLVGSSLTEVTLDTEMSSAEGLRFLSSDVCPVLQPTPTRRPTRPPATPSSTSPPPATPTATSTPDATPLVPEPSTVTLLLAGLGTLAGYAGLQWRARRRQ